VAAADVLDVIKEDTKTNLADLWTKVLHADRRRELLGSILYNLWATDWCPRFPITWWCGTSCATAIVGLKCRYMLRSECWMRNYGSRGLCNTGHCLYGIIQYSTYVSCADIVDPNS
jgi:hypothetical protein